MAEMLWQHKNCIYFNTINDDDDANIADVIIWSTDTGCSLRVTAVVN